MTCGSVGENEQTIAESRRFPFATIGEYLDVVFKMGVNLISLEMGAFLHTGVDESLPLESVICTRFREPVVAVLSFSQVTLHDCSDLGLHSLAIRSSSREQNAMNQLGLSRIRELIKYNPPPNSHPRPPSRLVFPGPKPECQNFKFSGPSISHSS